MMDGEVAFTMVDEMFRVREANDCSDLRENSRAFVSYRNMNTSLSGARSGWRDDHSFSCLSFRN